MNSRPLVTVILPVYNERREYLESAVESILRQTYGNLEFLIADDGSGPETAAILDEMVPRDPRIRLIRHENLGLTRTLNKLIRQSHGAFIARQDSDDISELDRIERQVSCFSSRPELMLLGTGCLLIDAQDKVLYRERVKTRSRTLKRILKRTNQFVHGSVMFRSEVFLKYGYYEEYRYAEDYDLFSRIAEKCEIDNIDLPLYRYRINPEGISVAKMREQLYMGMIVREAGRLRRAGLQVHWSQEANERIAASLNTTSHQRKFKSIVCTAQARNLLLVGKKKEAWKKLYRAFVSSPGIRELWRLVRCVVPRGYVH